MNQLKIRPLLFGLTALTSTIIFGLTFWFANYYLGQSLTQDFNVGLYNYAVDLAEAVELAPHKDVAIPIETYLDKNRIFPFQHGKSLVEIYNREGKTLFRYTLNEDAPASRTGFLKHLDLAQDEFYSDFEENGIQWRSLTLGLDAASPPTLFLKVTVPLDFLESQISDVSQMLFLAAGLGVLVLSILLAMVSRLLTRPLESLSNEVSSFQPGGNTGHITVPSGPKELRILGVRFNELLARVDRMVRAEKEFATHAAHQLKTPLTIARGHLELLAKELSGDKAATAHVGIAEIDHLAQVVNNLLMLSSMESRTSQLRLEPLNLGDLLSQTMERLEPLANQMNRRFRLKIDVDDMEMLCLKSDAHFLSEAIRNLLENAIRYSTAEVIDVRISQLPHSLSLGVENEVKTPVVLDSRPNSSGHGLGLVIARRIVSLLDMTLELDAGAQRFAARIIIKKN